MQMFSEITCAQRETPFGAYIIDGEEDLYLPHSQIAYGCLEGFKEIRGGSVICSGGGTWIGLPLMCQGINVSFLCLKKLV